VPRRASSRPCRLLLRLAAHGQNTAARRLTGGGTVGCGVSRLVQPLRSCATCTNTKGVSRAGRVLQAAYAAACAFFLQQRELHLLNLQTEDLRRYIY
jgi:hypothetical protein